jgi:predicted dehydrogenase
MYRILQLGAGAWGASWAQRVRMSPHVDLVGVVEPDEVARRAVADAADIPSDRGFADLETALDAGLDAEVALLVTPPRTHAPLAVRCLEAGLHCLIEKPLADSMPAAQRIVAVAERVGRQVMVSQNYRFKQAPRTVRRLIREGVVGDVEQVRVNFAKRPMFTGFRAEMNEPLIVDMSIHHLDQLRGIVGLEPTELRAQSWNPTWSTYAGNAAALIEGRTAAGARFLYTGSWVSHGPQTTWDGTWDIQGTRGGILWELNRVTVRFASVFDTVFLPHALEREHGLMEVRLDDVTQEERLGTLAEFATALDEGRLPETSGAQNLRSLALVLAAIDSARSGGATVRLEELLRPGASVAVPAWA